LPVRWSVAGDPDRPSATWYAQPDRLWPARKHFIYSHVSYEIFFYKKKAIKNQCCVLDHINVNPIQIHVENGVSLCKINQSTN
jgi:hypothetical protein